jgi:hypothetical protein
LPGNNGTLDKTKVYRGQTSTTKTLNIEINGQPAFSGVESAINSLTVIGSNDADTLVIPQTAAGLPMLQGLSPGGHTNAAFLNANLTPTNVSIHYDGGPAGTDGLELYPAAGQTVSHFHDVVDTANSGVINVKGVFTLSYESLTPILIQGMGGALNLVATDLPGLTQLNLKKLSSGGWQLSGDGGFETTQFSGFDTFFIRPLDGVPLRFGKPGAPEYTLTRAGDQLTIVGDKGDNRVTIVGNAVGQNVTCGDWPTFTFTGIDGVQLQTLDGNDRVDISMTGMHRVMATLGTGDDRFSYQAEPTSDGGPLMVAVSGGFGNDKLNATFGHGPGVDLPISTLAGPAALNLKGGAGADVINVLTGGLKIPQFPRGDMLAVSALGGTGEDRITLSAPNVSLLLDSMASFMADGGLGMDKLQFAMDGLLLGTLKLQMNGGEDNDFLGAVFALSAERGGHLNTLLQGGTGDDELSQQVTGDGELAAFDSLLDGGAGFDRARRVPMVKFQRIEKFFR